VGGRVLRTQTTATKRDTTSEDNAVSYKLEETVSKDF